MSTSPRLTLPRDEQARTRAAEGSSGEHRHLRRRTNLEIFSTDRNEPRGVPMGRGDLSRPRLKLGARPLEAVITVAHSLSGERWEAHVVLTVGRREDDGWWTRVLKDDALERRQTRGSRGFGDLHPRCRAE